MGHFQVPLNTLGNGKSVLQWFPLKNFKKFKHINVQGSILIKIKFDYNPLSYFLSHFSPAVQDRITGAAEHLGEIKGSNSNTAASGAALEVENPYEPFSPGAFTAHILRIINVVWPFLEFYWAFWDLLLWKNPLTSTTAMILWCFLCLNSHLLPQITIFFLIIHVFSHHLSSLGTPIAKKNKPKPKSKSVRQQWKDLGYTQASLGATADMLCQILHMFDWSNREITLWMLYMLGGAAIFVALIPFNILIMLTGVYMFISNTRIFLGLYYLVTQTNPRYNMEESMWDILPKEFEKPKFDDKASDSNSD